MKRKSMLLDKIMEYGHGMGREVIGLIGTHHGVGVTHIGPMLAFYMSEELGKKTAFLECNDHRDMKLIQAAYEWSREDAFSFSFHQITCYNEVIHEHISDIFGDDYECLILDFGIDLDANREEYLRCSTKIVIGGRSEWDIQKLKQFSFASKELRGSDSWQYFIPQANDKIVQKISNELGRKVWQVPFIEEPTKPSHISNRFFRRIFRA